MGRILGIDFGSRRMGLALSDSGCTIASPHKTLRYRSVPDLVRQLASLIKDKGVDRVVVGLPIGMKGQRTHQTAEVEEFVDTLARHLSIPVDVMDERLTTVEATRSLRRQGFKPSLNKPLIDETAAAILLQSYLDSQSSP